MTTEAKEKGSGLHPGMTWEEYAAIDAANSSILRLMDVAAKARQEQLHPADPTAALDLGNAIHACVFETKRFYRDYVKRPSGIDKRTKAGKAAWAALEAEHPGATVLSAEDWQTCIGIQTKCWAHPVVNQLLAGKGLNEVGCVWTDEPTGLLCKARLDRITTYDGWTTILDLKTTTDASPDAFARAVYNYGYHEQAAFYLAGADALAPLARRHLFVAVEKSPPYCVAVYELDAEAMDAGKVAWRRHLDVYARCLKDNHWPGYQSEVRPLALPRWAVREVTL